MDSKNRVGLGTFPLASVFNPISKRDAEMLVKTFIDKGGYYIDTAPMYGFGSVEALLGKALKNYSRDSFYIATKCGYINVEGKTFQTIEKSGRYKDVIRECENSLKRLGVDYIDLYFMHSPDPSTPIEETVRALIKLKEIGKIKQIGVSNVNLEELKEYNLSGKVEFVQNRYSLLNQSINKDLEQYMSKHKIKLVPYQVIDRGQLTGSILEGVGKLKGNDLRIGRSDWLPEKVEFIAKWSKKYLLPIAKDLGITLGQLSIAWALKQPLMGFVIVGTTNPSYLEINLKANHILLDDGIIKKIDSVYKILRIETKQKFGQSIREFRGLNEKYY